MSLTKTKLNQIFVVLLSAIFLISPFLVDVKITRPKLMFFEVGFAAMFFLWLAANIYHGELALNKNPLNTPVLVYCLLTAIFYCFSPNRALSYTELKRVLLFGAAFFAVSNIINTKTDRNILIYSFIAGTFWAALYGILQFTGGFWRISVPKMERVFSTFGNPIFFGVYLAFAIPIILGFFLSQKNTTAKILCAVALILSVIALYYTRTRASWLGFGIGLLLFVIFTVKKLSQKILLISAVFAIGTVFLYFTRDVWVRQQAHLLIWRDTLNMWRTNPFSGVGLGLFHIHFPEFASEQLRSIWPQANFIINDAHNEYIQILSETGIVGFSVFIWTLFSFFYFTARHIKRNPKNYLSVGIFIGCAALLFQNIFSVDMRFIISGVYLFSFIGLASSRNNEHFNVVIPQKFLRLLVSLCLLIAGYFTLMKVLEPYRAVKSESQKVDFFDEKILDASKTIEELESLAAKHPAQSLVFEKLGWVHAKERNFAKAIENYNKAISLKPENPGPYNNIGNIYFLTNQHSKAIEYYLNSISIKPEQIDSRINLALAYYYQGELSPAAAQLKEVLRLDPNNEKAITLMKKMRE